MAEKLKFRAAPGYLIVDGEKVVATGDACRAKIGDRVVWDGIAAGTAIKVDRLPYLVIRDDAVRVENPVDD